MPAITDLVAFIEKKGPKTTKQLAEHYGNENYGAVSQCAMVAKNKGLIENDGKGTPWRIAGTSAPAAAPKASVANEPAGGREAQILELLPATKAAIAWTLGESAAAIGSMLTRMKAKGIVSPDDKRGGPWHKATNGAATKVKRAPKPKTLADVAAKHVEAATRPPAPFEADFMASLLARRDLAQREVTALDALLDFYRAR